MQPEYAQPFSYHIHWRSRHFRAGYHRGSQAGLGMEFRGNAAFLDAPDARRIDISQTIRDPAEQVQVRIFQQRNSTAVYAACDMSASMQFTGKKRKLQRAAEIAASIACSAHQASDPFAFIGFDDQVYERWSTRPSMRMQEAYALIDEVNRYTHRGTPTGNPHTNGMLDISMALGAGRGLVFLISDFHLPLPQIEQTLNALSQHHVVPVVLWDSAEYSELPSFGFGTLYDAETGQQRTLFFRKTLKALFMQKFLERKAALQALFLKYDMPPYFVEGEFNPDTLSEYFHQFSAP